MCERSGDPHKKIPMLAVNRQCHKLSAQQMHSEFGLADERWVQQCWNECRKLSVSLSVWNTGEKGRTRAFRDIRWITRGKPSTFSYEFVQRIKWLVTLTLQCSYLEDMENTQGKLLVIGHWRKGIDLFGLGTHHPRKIRHREKCLKGKRRYGRGNYLVNKLEHEVRMLLKHKEDRFELLGCGRTSWDRV